MDIRKGLQFTRFVDQCVGMLYYIRPHSCSQAASSLREYSISHLKARRSITSKYPRATNLEQSYFHQQSISPNYSQPLTITQSANMKLLYSIVGLLMFSGIGLAAEETEAEVQVCCGATKDCRYDDLRGVVCNVGYPLASWPKQGHFLTTPTDLQRWHSGDSLLWAWK